MKYSWFQNRNKVNFLNKTGYGLNVDTLKIEILDVNKKFNVNTGSKTFRIDALGKCKTDDNKLAMFGISMQGNKLFVIRLNNEMKYSSEIMYKRGDFLSLCTQISKKLKG